MNDRVRVDELLSPATEALRIVTLDEFADLDEAGADAILGSPDSALIPEAGDVMFYGDGGAGKTTLTIDLAFHLAAGDPWLGIPVTRPVTVLLVENEGPRSLFRRKLARKRDGWNGSDLADRIRVFEHPWAAFSFADTGWRHRLADAAQALEVDVIIVGPLASAGMDAAGTLAEVRDFIALVTDLRVLADRPLTVILIHHENKGGRVSGAWEGAGDALFHVQAQGHGRVRLYVQKARWSSDRHATTLQLVWAGGDGFALDETVEPARPERVWDDIADYVMQHGGTGWNAVDQAVSGQGDYKRRRRDQMLADGMIVNVGSDSRMRLWHRDDPVRPTLDTTASEPGRTSDAVASGTGDVPEHATASPRPLRSRDAVRDAVGSTPPDEPEAPSS